MKNGDTKIAKSVVNPYLSAKTQMCFYQKMESIPVKTVCTIDDLEKSDDINSYINEMYPQDDTQYALIGEKEQAIKDEISDVSFSNDGKTIMISDEKKLIAYSKKIEETVITNSVNIQEDGNYTFFTTQGEEKLQIYNIDGKQSEVSFQSQNDIYRYIDEKHIVYQTEDGLYLYDGEKSEKIGNDVKEFWCKNKLSSNL